MHLVVQVRACEGSPLVLVEPDTAATVAAIQTEIHAMTDFAACKKMSAFGTQLSRRRILNGKFNALAYRLFGQSSAVLIEPPPILKRLNPAPAAPVVFAVPGFSGRGNRHHLNIFWGNCIVTHLWTSIYVSLEMLRLY
jgi:hypothetical protein